MPSRHPRSPDLGATTRVRITRPITATRTIQAHGRIIDALNRIATYTLRQEPLSTVLHAVVQEVSAATDFPIVAIALYEPTLQLMEFVAATGVSPQVDFVGLRVPVDQSLVGQAARRGQAVIVTQANKQPVASDPLLRQVAAQTLLCLPIAANGHPFGTLALAHPDAVPLHPDRVPMAQSLADFIATLLAHRQAEERSALEEQHLHEIMDRLAAGVVQLDADGNFLYVNRRAAADFGLTPSDMIGKSITDIHPPAFAQAYLERNRRFIAAQGYIEREESFDTPIGPRTFFIADQVLSDAHGVGHSLLASTIDITARKADEEARQRSERTFRELYEHMRDAFVSFDMQGRICRYNRSFQELLGYSDDELLRMTYQDLTPPQWHSAEERIVQEEVLQQGYSALYEKEYRRKDGSIVPIELRIVLTRDDQGRPSGMWAIIRDITERRQAEGLVVAQRDMARMLATATSPDDAWPRCLELALRLTGMDSGGIYLFDDDAQALELVYHEGLTPSFVCMVERYAIDTPNAQLVRSGEAPYYTYTCDELQALAIPPDEGMRALAIVPIRDHTRVLGCINLGSHSLTQVPTLARHALETIGAEIGNLLIHLRTKAALRVEQQRFSTVTETVPGAICTFQLRPDGTLSIPYASPVFEDLYGLTPADVRETIDPLIARIPPDQLSQLIAAVRESAHTLQPWRNEYRYHHPQKGEIWVEGYSMPVRDADGGIRWHGFTTDITERKRTEEQLRQSEVRFRALIEHAPGAICMVGADGKLRYVSSSTERVMGYHADEMLGIDPSILTHPDDLPALLQVLTELMQVPGQVQTTQYRFRHRDGAWRWVESTISNLLHEPSVNAVTFNFQDITERKQADLALRASEEQYRGLMESLDSVVATVNAAGTFLYVNNVGARMLGRTVEDVIGKTMAELFPKRVAVVQSRVVQRVIRDDTALVNEALSVINGQPRWYRNSVQPLHDETGRAVAALINATNIHDLKTAQQELKDLNRTLEERVRQRTAEVRDLYEHAPTGYHSLDAEGKVILINQTELDWLGYTREEIVGRPITDLFTPVSRATFHLSFPRFKKRGLLRGLEMELIRKDGTTFPVLISATAVYDEQGTYVMSRSTLFDITQRKAAENALRESEAQNRLLFEASPDALVLMDERGQVVRMNDAFARMTGYDTAQLAGQRLEARGLLSERANAQFAAALMQAQHSTTSAATEFSLTSADAVTHEVGARVFALQIHGMQHYLAALRDITAEKQAAVALRQTNAELARVARAKDEFLANMSHELRTPLNAMLSLSESLQEQIYGPLSPLQYETIGRIDAAGRHLLTLINDILDLSKVETGRLELYPERVSVHEICQSSMIFVREQAVKKHLVLDISLNDPQAFIEADPRRLKQILVNLLSNAVKFTPMGGAVTLEVTLDRDARVARFAVVDTGIGIDPDDLERLFQPFSQLDPALNRNHEGTGLGLALVRRLAELHGGSVAVESAPGKGSRFSVILPYRDASEAPAPAGEALHALPSGAAPGRAAKQQRGLILLAEDNEANSGALSDYLHARGYEVVVARDGYQALKWADEVHPQLIVMDIQMPRMDGLEATRRLRAQPAYATTPIIALTALAMPGDEARCLAAGATAYMTKPVSLRGLVETIERLLEV